MYQHSTASYMSVHRSHSLPSPEYTGDSDSDSEVIKELEQKRRELDEEVARFRALKEHEFREFEADLKARRKQQRAQSQKHRHNAIDYYEFTKNSPSATPPSNPALKGYEKKSRSPSQSFGSKQSEPMRLMKPHVGSKVTPPTICLDKMNITGENMLQSHVSPSQTPPTPTAFSILEHNRHNHSPATTSATVHSEQTHETVPLSPEEHMQEESAALTGLFVPGFLPIFDVRSDVSDRQVTGTQTEPASPTGPSMVESVAVHASSLPIVSSLSESFQMPQAKRAYTSPSTLNRSKLPPIIRNKDGRANTNGKRKHVTFQLADRAIVEPSSSYEEGPSPDMDDAEARKDSTDSLTSESSAESLNRPKIQRRNTPMDMFGRRKRQPKPLDTPEEEVGMSMGDLLLGSDQNEEAEPAEPKSKNNSDGYFSLKHLAQTTSSPSPEKSNSFSSVDEDAYMHKRKGLLTEQKQQRRNSRSPRTSPTVSRQTSYENNALIPTNKPSPKAYQSPHFNPMCSSLANFAPHEYPGTLEDDLLLGGGNVGFFELDEELNGPEAGLPKPDLPEDKEEDLAMSRLRESKTSSKSSKEVQPGSSVPIDIIRPGSMSVSNSWVGTFGH